jgi:hypothetical protein
MVPPLKIDWWTYNWGIWTSQNFLEGFCSSQYYRKTLNPPVIEDFEGKSKINEVFLKT